MSTEPTARCLDVSFGSRPCENSNARRARRNILEKLRVLRTDNAADIRLDAMSENCVFYISPMYEFSHSLDPKRTSGRHPNKPFQSGIVSLSAGWVGRMRRCEFLGVLGGAAATLAVCTTVLNAADEKAFEKALLGHIMWSAFQCSTYAELSDYKSEQERLHLVGLNAGRTFLEAMKAGQISEQALREAVPINVLQRLEGPSNEVIIDKIYAAATGYARDYIVKRKTGIWGPTEKQEARSYYTNHNCILIR